MASMSHEMRTPLNGVLGMLQLALELELPPRGLKFVQNAMMSAQVAPALALHTRTAPA